MLATAYAIEINESNLQQVIEQSTTQPVVFYFWSQQSPHCQALGATLDKLAAEHAGQFTLAKVNCDTEQMVAAQFGLRAIPTVYLLQKGHPIDGFQGPQSEEFIREMLSHVLTPEELKTAQATELMAAGKTVKALPLLKEAHQLAPNNSEISLTYAEALITLNQLDESQKILNTVVIQDQDSRYQSLIAKIELRKKAADTPEIQQLQSTFAQQPKNTELAIQLVLKLHEVNRNEEALEILLTFLKQDLSAGGGSVKKIMMDILSALGISDPLANRYRQQLYSLL